MSRRRALAFVVAIVPWRASPAAPRDSRHALTHALVGNCVGNDSRLLTLENRRGSRRRTTLGVGERSTARANRACGRSSPRACQTVACVCLKPVVKAAYTSVLRCSMSFRKVSGASVPTAAASVRLPISAENTAIVLCGPEPACPIRRSPGRAGSIINPSP
jgi:hypothetical protein